MLNIEILNDLNNWNYTIKLKLKLPAGGGMSLILSLNHSLNWFVRTSDSFRNEAKVTVFMNGSWITDSLDSFKHAVHSWMKHTAVFAFRDAQRLSCYLFGTIFLDDMAQNQAVVLYSDNVSHLILTSCYWTVVLNQCHICKLFKICLSVYHDLWSHRNRSIRERASEFSFTLNKQDSKARANDTLRHLSSRYKHGTCVNE